jgi:hypothetical protein
LSRFTLMNFMRKSFTTTAQGVTMSGHFPKIKKIIIFFPPPF